MWFPFDYALALHIFIHASRSNCQSGITVVVQDGQFLSSCAGFTLGTRRGVNGAYVYCCIGVCVTGV